MNTTITSLELPGLPAFKSGKVREIFDLGGQLLFVATDRISAFDCILGSGIPRKGEVLTQLSAWWFERLKHVVQNHIVSCDFSDFPASFAPYREQLEGRSMLVRKTELLPVECIVRGYLIGSGWKEYQQKQSVCGIPLPEGYRMADRLEQPLFTPSTKAEEGHDENITFEQVQQLVGAKVASQLREASIALYKEAAAYAIKRGIIIADTKFEFGLLDGELMLIDEILTPDSSRFWPLDTYQPGQSPLSFDKQYVRDYLETLDWDKTPPAPALPEDVVSNTTSKYLEAYELLTGKELGC